MRVTFARARARRVRVCERVWNVCERTCASACMPCKATYALLMTARSFMAEQLKRLQQDHLTGSRMRVWASSLNDAYMEKLQVQACVWARVRGRMGYEIHHLDRSSDNRFVKANVLIKHLPD